MLYITCKSELIYSIPILNWVSREDDCSYYCVWVSTIGYKDGPEQFIAPAVIIRHPEYDHYTINNDIMLIKLAEPGKFDDYVQPVALPSSCAPACTQCLVSRWGAPVSLGFCLCQGCVQGEKLYTVTADVKMMIKMSL